MAYVPTTWINYQSPPLSATNLNKLTDELESQAATQGVSHTLPTWANGVAPALTDAVPLNEIERVVAAVSSSLGLTYTPTVWQTGWIPARNAIRLNQLENAVAAASEAMVGRPPLPPAWTGPVTITSGGVYEVAAEASGSQSCVTIATTQAVTLRGWTRKLTTSGNAPMIDAIISGANVTIEDMYGYGGFPWQNSVRFIWTGNHHTLIIRNCQLQYTCGIEVGPGTPGVGQVLITKNRHNEFQGSAPAGSIQKIGNFVQFRVTLTPTIEVSWNESNNTFPNSFAEDWISLYHTSNAQILNNALFHQSEPNNVLNSSFGGITIDASDTGSSAPVSNNLVRGNHLSDAGSITLWPTATGGSNNLIELNRLVSDRFLPNGAQKNNTFVGILIQPGGSNNHAHNNEVGFWTKDGGRTDYILTGAPEGNAGEIANNTSLPEPINSALEQAERGVWNNKVAANGITIGP